MSQAFELARITHRSRRYKSKAKRMKEKFDRCNLSIQDGNSLPAYWLTRLARLSACNLRGPIFHASLTFMESKSDLAAKVASSLILL